MSLPTSEPLQPKDAPGRQAASAHRRRPRGLPIPSGREEQAAFLKELAYRVTPSFDYFLFSMLAGLALAVAILVDSPAFYVLAALLSPFMAPVVGLAFAAILGSPRFLLKMLGSLAVGSLIVFAWGVLTGWLARLWPGLAFVQAPAHASSTWPDLILLALGAGLTAYTLVRSPHIRPLVTSVALSYELYLPVGIAGFGLSSGLPGLWPDGLLTFGLHLGLAVLIGMVVLALLGLRLKTFFSYLLGSLVGLASLVALVYAGTQGMIPSPLVPAPVVIPTSSLPSLTPIPSLPPATGTAVPPQASRTLAATYTPTNTLIPTGTPTLTITPAPTPVWAYIHSEEGGGAIIRQSPSFQAAWAKSLLNGMLVEVLPETQEADKVTWVKIRTSQGLEGWIVRSLLTTATPAPGG